jgi:NSS family neurotransmitter:Na+ symporter
VCIVFVCAPILIAEIALGRAAGLSPVGAFERFRPGSKWWLVGALGVVSGVGIVSFYSVIGGWTLAYAGIAAVGGLGGNLGELFMGLISRGGLNIALTFIFIASAAAANVGGVRDGIERVTKVLMPVLIGLLVLLCVRALTLPGASEGLEYYFKPDFAKALDPSVFNAALGQAFFSLSLGNGCMLTYGSYLSRKESISRSAFWVVALDTSIALVAGLIVFPVGFTLAGFDPSSSGPGLLFITLPELFATLPAGAFFGVAFFILLALAALTSAISLLEIPVSHCIDQFQWSRKQSVGVIAGSAFALSIPCALAGGAVDFLTNFTAPAWGGDYLQFTATMWNNFALPIGGLMLSIFVGWIWGVDKAIEELVHDHAWFPAPKLWGLLVRYVAPVAIIVILLTGIWPLFF